MKHITLVAAVISATFLVGLDGASAHTQTPRFSNYSIAVMATKNGNQIVNTIFFMPVDAAFQGEEHYGNLLTMTLPKKICTSTNNGNREVLKRVHITTGSEIFLSPKGRNLFIRFVQYGVNGTPTAATGNIPCNNRLPEQKVEINKTISVPLKMIAGKQEIGNGYVISYTIKPAS